jgi:hypothetical protein
VESKNKEDSGFERQSVVVFADDLQDFLKGFDDSLKVLEKAAHEHKRPARERTPRDKFARDKSTRDKSTRDRPPRGKSAHERPPRENSAREDSSGDTPREAPHEKKRRVLRAAH